MTALTRLQQRRLMMRVIREAELTMGFEEGAILSDRRVAPVVRTRQVCMLVGLEELQFTTTPLGRLMRRDHTTVIWGARAARKLIADEPWRSLHAGLVAFVRQGIPLPKPTPPAPQSPPAPGAGESGVAADMPRKGRELSPSALDAGWPARAVAEQQNQAFVEAMRRAHPEREIGLGRRG